MKSNLLILIAVIIAGYGLYEFFIGGGTLRNYR